MRIVWSFGIAVALLAASVAAQPQVPLHAQGPQLEVWAEPLGMALSAGGSRGDDEAALLYAPIEVTWRASPGARPWTVELAPLYDVTLDLLRVGYSFQRTGAAAQGSAA